MSKQADQNDQTNEPKTEFKVVSSLDQIAVIEAAVQSFLENISVIAEVEGGQLGILSKALRDYPEPMTEAVWDRVFKANVTALFVAAKDPNGDDRYANKASQEVMTNLFKVATMGLTLAKVDPAYKSNSANSKNLKKYAETVRPMLQAAIDPATGKPRLRSIAAAPKPPKKLAPDTYYWLIGCTDAELGIEGANDVVGAHNDIRKLEQFAARLAGKYQSFLYCEAKMEPLTPQAEEEDLGLLIQNAAVMSSTFQAD